MSECPRAHDDGAYVLGALSSVERADYERHLAECATCRDAVAAVAALPALLRRLDAWDGAAPPLPADEPLGGPDQPPVRRDESAGAANLPGLIDAVQLARRRERNLGRWRHGVTAVAAAGLALAVGLGLASSRPEPAPPRADATPTVDSSPAMAEMNPVRQTVPVRAEIGLRSAGWGTEVALQCRYPRPRTAYSDASVFHLVAYGPDRATEQLGSWSAAPGDDVRLTGFTRFGIGDLQRIELVGSNGQALLAYDVP